MAMNNISGTIAGQKWNSNDYSDKAAYVGKNIQGSTQVWYTFALKFTIPEFIGVSESLTFTLSVSDGVGDPVNLRYAICTSDANFASYRGTGGAVADEYQVATGTIAFTGLQSNAAEQIFSIPTTKLKGGSYYLILWAASSEGGQEYVTVEYPSDHTVVLGYNTGLIQLTVGGQVINCAVDVYTDGKWVENLLPEVKTDGKYVICS